MENISKQENKTGKKIFGLGIYEFTLLVLDILSVIFVFIFFDKSWLSFSCSLIGCFAILFLAKGYFFAPAVNIVYDILYIILSYTQKYFGEAIIYLTVTMPIELYACFSWRKSKSKKNNEIVINKLSKKEWIIFTACSISLAVGAFFVLRAIGTDEVFVSTLSFITLAMAGYLVLRKNNYYSLVYSCNDAICAVLWTLTLIKGDTSCLPIAVNFSFNFLIEFYGFFHLRKLAKQQEKSLQKEETKNKNPEDQEQQILSS